MISNRDLSRKLGKNIKIYPFDEKYVDGASVFVTSSKMAWSLQTKKNLVVNETITIPPNETALVVTKEFISLDNKHCAICVARNRLNSKGLAHYSSPIKPRYTGRLLITLHNDTNEKIPIKIGDKIAVLLFFELTSEASVLSPPPYTKVYARLHDAGITENLIDTEFDIAKLDPKVIENSDSSYRNYKKTFSQKLGWLNKKRHIYLPILLFVLLAPQIMYYIFGKNEAIKSLLAITMPTILGALMGVLISPLINKG
jgi:dUTPase